MKNNEATIGLSDVKLRNLFKDFCSPAELEKMISDSKKTYSLISQEQLFYK